MEVRFISYLDDISSLFSLICITCFRVLGSPRRISPMRVWVASSTSSTRGRIITHLTYIDSILYTAPIITPESRCLVESASLLLPLKPQRLPTRHHLGGGQAVSARLARRASTLRPNQNPKSTGMRARQKKDAAGGGRPRRPRSNPRPRVMTTKTTTRTKQM